MLSSGYQLNLSLWLSIGKEVYRASDEYLKKKKTEPMKFLYLKLDFENKLYGNAFKKPRLTKREKRASFTMIVV